jgi:DNA-binding SARP family transcriptional activator
VLGPLEVEAAPLRSQMERRLLAALLCRPNEVVPLDDLITALWGEEEPPSARKTLQVYVRRLRTALDDEQRIAHEPSGYRIQIDPHELDALQFAELVRRGFLGQALELWRGKAFEDVREHAPIADEARALDEERLRVEARHTELQLEQGRHAEVVPHLTRLIEVHPYREDLRGFLMLALYRCGRQSEALDLFEGTRKLLAAELGIQPGPALQSLHKAILSADSTLDLPQRQRSTVPRELPADIPSFVGRDSQQRMLDEMLPGSSPVVISAIAGSAGVGKTTLAVHWAHSVAEKFQDGQLYVNLRGFDPSGPPVDPAEAIRRFLDALGVAPQSIPPTSEAQSALYRSLLADRRMLIVLDNARDAEQVRPLLPGSPSCLVVLTSRNRLASLVATSGARALMLDVLTVTEARELLAARLGTKRMAAEPGAVDEIIERCARLPLALAVAAAQVATDPDLSLSALARELGDAHVFDSDDPMTDLRAVFSSSYRQLSAGAARLFRLLGVHLGPDISTAAAESLAGGPVERELSELVQAHLIAEHAPGRYAFHDLLRTYAAELAASSDGEDNDQAVLRVLDHYLQTGYAADRLMDPSRDPISLLPSVPGVTPEVFADRGPAMAWFAAERATLLAAVRQAARAGLDSYTWQLAWTLRTFFDWQGLWQDWTVTLHAALDAAQRLDDVDGQAYAHRGLGRAYSRIGQLDDAYTYGRHALDLYQRHNDVSGQAHAHMALSGVRENQGRFAEALEHAQSGRGLFDSAGERVWHARALNAVGFYYAELGDHQQALEHCQLGLDLMRELGDRAGEAITSDSIGYAHYNLGQYPEALASLLRALELYRELGVRHFEGTSLHRLGDTYQAMGDTAAAGRAWQEALDIFAALGHPDLEKVRAKMS